MNFCSIEEAFGSDPFETSKSRVSKVHTSDVEEDSDEPSGDMMMARPEVEAHDEHLMEAEDEEDERAHGAHGHEVREGHDERVNDDL